ncbi:MAG: hypothetical protein EXS31_02870 [Pedosphaera sp.]|nr:hypothetical protein [Pedosphaera sp.]
MSGSLNWLRGLLLLWVMATGLGGIAQRVEAAEGKADWKFEVQLIWGTNDEKPSGKELKEVEVKITEGLKGIFKWKNYFEVTRKKMDVAGGATQRLKMSDKCDVEVQSLGGSNVEIRLIGEGKCVNKVKQTISAGRLITIAGGDKNDTAWFVILKPL